MSTKVIKKILDTQLPHSPKDVFYCKKCVVSNQRPRITFDKDGVCSACHYVYEKNNKIDWKARHGQLLQLLDRHRSKDGSYDCIVPGSGGKDSIFVSHKLKYEYGMHPLDRDMGAICLHGDRLAKLRGVEGRRF